MANLNKYMFREYDIRGKETDDELSADAVAHIAKAYGTWLINHNIKTAVVGHDSRKRSEEYYQISKQALLSTGVNVVGIGMCLSPMLYWAQHHLQILGGLMVTASHNPAGWNGVKLASGLSETFGQEEIKEIYALTQTERYITGEGSEQEKNITEEWMQDLLCRVKLERPLKIILNTANATGCFFAPEIFRRLGCEVVELNTNPDSSFPNYLPNPANVEMMEDTGKHVVQNKCDVGVGIDADGDRLGLTDELGQIIWPDRWLILLARQVLEKHPHSSIVFDVKCSESLAEDILAHGGVPVMWKTGHTYIVEKMRELGSPLGGEMSGHIMLTDNYYGFDDGVFAGLKILEYLSSTTVPFSKVLDTAPKYFSTPAYHVETGDAEKYKIEQELVAGFKSDGFRVVDINGGRVYMEDGWGLIRASSNLPVLVLRFEAKTQEGLKRIEEEFRRRLGRFDKVGTVWVSA